jgi:NADH:ubiquinone oxidoreductase subunit F (NADH-binding)
MAVATSGPSGGFVPRMVSTGGPRETAKFADILDAQLDIDAFRKLGLALGAGLAVYARGADMTAAAVNATAFYRNESCGKCVPCRVGSQKLLDIGRGLLGRTISQDEQLATKQVVGELDKALGQTSICGLGPSASKPLVSLLQYFPLTTASGSYGRPPSGAWPGAAINPDVARKPPTS